MSGIIGSNINSAIASGVYGLQSASAGITEASENIAQRTAEGSSRANGETASAPESGNVTDDLIALKVNSLNAQANAKSVDAAFGTIGTIIDTVA